ncbi:DNA-binding protein [Thiomicrospira microaerophila]|uniref:helix-turn-helix domain-containing protein n=1 Tax=Thiomicrospira microaerophila TaxID=406020 RepID=UPI00200F5B6F|nr:helix-turn-helix domain-containing protein [Thiomicrospira microaerophila]UQB41938.1 DNA-binding protein [Thiomicrospira microaerophila]
MKIKPIRTKDEYQEALSRIDSLFDAQPGTDAGDELEVLITLVDAYESKMYVIEAPDPIEAIKFRMEQQGLSDADLTPMLGQRSRVSEVLNRKRRLSLSMIRKLHQGLNIPLESLISDYQLSV